MECIVGQDIDEEDTEKFEVAAIGVIDIKGNRLNQIGICGNDGVELIDFNIVKTILTKEQYEQNCYKLDTN